MRKQRGYNSVMFIFLVSIFTTSSLKAQTLPGCGYQRTATSNASASQPANCSDLLNSFVPSPSDSIKYVNINFFIITPSNGPGSWGTSTASNADYLIFRVNQILANLQLPYLPGSQFSGHSRIQVVRNHFNVIADDSDYVHLGALGQKYASAFPDGVNVFFASCNGMSCQARVQGPLPNPNILFPRNNVANISAEFENFLHELGHALGLEHSQYLATQPGVVDNGASSISPNWGCCNHLVANDHMLEGLTVWGNPGCPPTSVVSSNNIMGYNFNCRQYLSSKQLAVIHYNLTTSIANVLANYNAITSRDPAFDYNVTFNETWTVDRYMKGNITVKAGKTLTVKCGLAMPHGARIFVEKTGVLIIDGGTITNMSNRTWDGIYMDGDATYPQTGQYQSIVKMINGATISHAKIGIRNHNTSYAQYGGIVSAGNSHFLNNEIDVQFVGSNTGAPNAVSTSKFYSCDFKTTGPIGDNLHPFAHANMYKSVGVQFLGCNFEYAQGPGASYYPQVGSGITSINSNFTVDKNGGTTSTFKNLLFGVYLNNYNPFRVPTIQNTKFIDNIDFGAYFMNANYLVFQNNVIQNPNMVIHAGVYLNNCKYYTIKNNTFLEDPANNYKSSPGLEIFNSGTGAHQVYKNSFSNLFIGINAMGDNSGMTNSLDGLKMNCNDFTQNTNLYDIALDLGASNAIPSVMTIQGVISGLSYTTLVRNMYAATCVNNGENKWYIHSSSNKQVLHGCNATSLNGEITSPSPQPGCSRQIINVVTSPLPLDYTTACGNPLLSGGTSTISSHRLNQMNNYLTFLKEEEINKRVDNHFEIQATVASKLNLFLTDSVLANVDSVITLLENNPGSMQDADIQVVFAYMTKGDYSKASERIAALPPAKREWADLLKQIMSVDQDNSEDNSVAQAQAGFFSEYAANDKISGQSISQAVLKATLNKAYTEPHNYPEGSASIDRRIATQHSVKANTEGVAEIKIYPNPANSGVTVIYNSPFQEPTVLELRDLLGKVIYTKFIINSGKEYLSLNGLSAGVYFITLSKDKQVITKSKLIKQD